MTGIALEWGTVDPLTVLMALRADNWLHHFGDPTGPDAAAIKAQIRAAFAPDGDDWAATVFQSFATVLDQTIEALADA